MQEDCVAVPLREIKPSFVVAEDARKPCDVYDVVIIGGGVSGAFAALELSRMPLRILLVDEKPEVAMGTTRSNSGIVHSGIHTKYGTLKNKLELKGNRLMQEMAPLMNVQATRCGELIVATEDAHASALEGLKAEAARKDIEYEVWNADTVRQREPNLQGIKQGLFIPNTLVINPFEICAAAVRTAQSNGVALCTLCKVVGVARTAADDCYHLTCERRNKRDRVQHLYARVIVNAAGVFAGAIASLADKDTDIVIRPRKGEEYILDKALMGTVSSIIFPAQSGDAKTKGILIIPTVDGTLMVGPTAEEVEDPEDTTTSSSGRDKVFASVSRICPCIGAKDIIFSFAGVRAAAVPTQDFIIRRDGCIVHCAGIQSPGLTAAPAIGQLVRDLTVEALRDCFYRPASSGEAHAMLVPKEGWRYLPLTRRACRMPVSVRKEYCTHDARFSTIVCGCEQVTVADVNNAITEGCRTLEGLKVRTRATAGRCQGGFCWLKMRQLLAERLGVTPEQVARGFDYEDGLPEYPEQGTAVGPYTPLSPDRPLAPVILAGSAAKRESIQAALRESRVVDVCIIGAGPAGLGAAEAASKAFGDDGARLVLVLEKSARTGGILPQCIHAGFGIRRYNKELTGPEYATLLQADVMATSAGVLLESFVTGVSFDEDTKLYTVSFCLSGYGYFDLRCRSLITATGCRERSFVQIAGTRPVGVHTAGRAQAMVNLEGKLPGKNCVVLGNGDIGLIMARRLAIEGAHVIGIYGNRPVASGLERNQIQCAQDFCIPMHLSRTVVRTHGRDHLESVDIARVDPATLMPDLSTVENVMCDCLIIAAGLLQQSQLTVAAGASGLSAKYKGPLVDSTRRCSDTRELYAAGNCLHVHDLVDNATEEGATAGATAAQRVLGPADASADAHKLRVRGSDDLAYVLPEFLLVSERNTEICFRPCASSGPGEVFAQIELQKGDERLVRPLGSIVVDGLAPAEMGVCPVYGYRMLDTAERLADGWTGTVEVTYKPRAPDADVEDAVPANIRKFCCIVCPRSCRLTVAIGDDGKVSTVEGNSCDRGARFAEHEIVWPSRDFSTTVPVSGGVYSRVAIKTKKPVHRNKILELAKEIRSLGPVPAPVKMGDLLFENVLGLVSFCACSDVPERV